MGKGLPVSHPRRNPHHPVSLPRAKSQTLTLAMSSSSSTISNPFAGPDVTLVRDLNIHERVPVKLDHTTASYSAWKRYFSLVFREYLLHGHVDGTVDSALMINDEEWMIRSEERRVGKECRL